MKPLFKSRSRKLGLPPGTPVYVGESASAPATITVIQYNEGVYSRHIIGSPEEISSFRSSDTVTWVNIDGLTNLDTLQKIGDMFGLHSLVIEDIANTDQRPKWEDFGDYVFLSLKMMYDAGTKKPPHLEQVSIILLERVVLSFQEPEQDVFGPVRERLAQNVGRLRKSGADYLVYSLVDAIVDNYFSVLEGIGLRTEQIESLALRVGSAKVTRLIHDLRREVIYMRKAIWPLREAVGAMSRDESRLLSSATRLHLRDVYDHIVQVIDVIETARDILASAMELQISSLSAHLNVVMKALTVVSSVFVPLTFIVGVYGMNFDFMPELRLWWAYPALWVIMIITAFGFLAYFRRQGWLSQRREE